MLTCGLGFEWRGVWSGALGCWWCGVWSAHQCRRRSKKKKAEMQAIAPRRRRRADGRPKRGRGRNSRPLIALPRADSTCSERALAPQSDGSDPPRRLFEKLAQTSSLSVKSGKAPAAPLSEKSKMRRPTGSAPGWCLERGRRGLEEAVGVIVRVSGDGAKKQSESPRLCPPPPSYAPSPALSCALPTRRALDAVALEVEPHERRRQRRQRAREVVER